MVSENIDFNAMVENYIASKSRIEKENVYHVSGILGCVRKGYLARRVEYKTPSYTLGIFEVGNALHNYFSNFLNHSEKMVDIVEEFEMKEKHIVDGEEVELVGHADYKVTTNLGNTFLIELKSISKLDFVYDKPTEVHRWQLSMYLKMANVKEGYIIYMCKTNFKLACHKISRDDKIYDECISRLHKLHKALKVGSLPDKNPLFQFECSYCPFKNKDMQHCSGKEKTMKFVDEGVAEQ